MKGRQRVPGPAQGRRDLDQTAGIRARVGVRCARLDVRRLPLAELSRGLRLDHVVDAGASAAELLLRRLGDGEAGSPGEHLPRSTAHALSVQEVAGVLKRDRHR